MTVTYVDLFAGIGGFCAVGSAFGWENVYASEIDLNASRIYRENWFRDPIGDITAVANDLIMDVPDHNVLFAGFPCQPFSKSGSQRGMDETRGTLFWNIAKVLEARRPELVVLENVRNLAGPRHIHEWQTIVGTIQRLGYKVSEIPTVLSPHKIHPDFGGRPQSRDRIFICASRDDLEKSEDGDFADALNPYLDLPTWDPKLWDLAKTLSTIPDVRGSEKSKRSGALSSDETRWLRVWDELQSSIGFANAAIRPGFPLWADTWSGKIKLEDENPPWKNTFIQKNLQFFNRHRDEILNWQRSNRSFTDFPASRRKLEWQAGDLTSIWDGLVQLRPSGIRVKRADYTPAFVAMNQTSVFGPEKRRLSVREVSYLQGLPSWFDFGEQRDAISYRQLGNGISVTAAYHAVRALVRRDANSLRLINPEIVDSVNNSVNDPTKSVFLAEPSVLQKNDFFKS